MLQFVAVQAGCHRRGLVQCGVVSVKHERYLRMVERCGILKLLICYKHEHLQYKFICDTHAYKTNTIHTE